MSPRDALGVLVRAGGILCLVAGVIDLLDALAVLTGLPLASGYTVARVLKVAAIFSIAGAMVLVAAGPLVRLLYRGHDEG